MLALLLGMLPILYMGYLALTGGLGHNPITRLERLLGQYGLIFLVLSLACTPLRRLTGYGRHMIVRRRLGLIGFFYAALHVAVWAVLDLGLYWPDIWADLLKRQYITLGAVAFVALLALAVTSPNYVIRRMNGRVWRRLHWAIYGAVPLVVVHYALMTRADFTLPFVYGGIVCVLLAVRLLPRK
jgi:sulfoxide reductase heme-binding subunit YedZ